MIKSISRWKTEKTISLQFICFITLFLVLIARNPVWTMLWDADGYMNSAIHWVTGGPREQVAEQLYYRGFLTSLVYYLPAFLGLNYFEPSQFGTYVYVFVIVQNAMIITTSILGFYALNAFVPYSLMDLWALACLLPVIYLINSQSKIAFLACGVLLGVCSNLRPSYLFTIVLLVGSAMMIQRISVPLMLPGFVISQIPQIVYNSKWNDSLSIFPGGLGKITERLATYAAYSIRYDTNAYGPFPAKG